ncbi:hypothetical protein BBJ28_00012964 [Nothophytophthora sp. Chile5]|nr:hypothetical protein BBJ28_00012964 [Nothophytophthora sp. Chile5]
MATQLIEHERIRTTLPKAKELRRIAEQVVTLAKKGDFNAKKRAEAIIRTPEAVTKLFDVVGPRYALREGGYTRILKADFRKGDGAEMAVIEYVDRYDPRQGVSCWMHCWLGRSPDLSFVPFDVRRPGEMRKAKPPQGIEAVREAFEAQASQ